MSAGEDGAPQRASPRRTKRKKRPRPVDDGAEATQQNVAEDAPDVAEDAPEIPSFARDWPNDPALDRLVMAFEGGDYARVRRDAAELARSAEGADVRRAARELVQRTKPDPVALYMLATAATLLVFLAGWYWSHPHP